MDHYRQIAGRGLCTSQRFEIVGPSDVGREARLDADDDIAVARDSTSSQIHVGAVEVVQLSAWCDSGARDVD
jgi:hypothetical protein